MAILSLPREVQQLVFLELPIKSLFALPCVCKEWNEALTEDFFRKKSQAYFPQWQAIPGFLEPVRQTLGRPWKWIAFSLSGIQVNVQFYPTAAKLAHLSVQKFKVYLSKLRLLHKIEMLDQIIAHRTNLEGYCTAITYHILSLLPHLKKWMLLLPKVDPLYREIKEEMDDPGSNPLRLSRIRESIMDLPDPVPEILCNSLYNLHGKKEEKLQWFSDHFHEHLSDLLFLLHMHLSDCNTLQELFSLHLDANPVLNLQFLEKFIEQGHLGCHYPFENPCPEEIDAS